MVFVGNILISAYACLPNTNSEPGHAWRIVLDLAPKISGTIFLLTREKNVPILIEDAKNRGVNNIVFVGVEASKFVLRLKKGHFGVHIYYYVWQLLSYFHARAILKKNAIKIAHHLSFMSIRSNFVPFLNVPSLVGPVGGAQLPPKPFSSVRFLGYKNLIRSSSIHLMRYSFFWRRFISKSDLILIANKDNVWIFDGLSKSNVHLMQTCSTLDHVFYGGESVEMRADQSTRRLLWVSRVEKWKGLEIALRSLQYVTSPSPILLDVVGRGADLEYFRRLAHNLNVDSIVKFHGYVSESEKTSLLKNADVCLFTSLHETTGTTLFEYMAAKKPIIALNHGGASSVLDTETAILVNPDRDPGEVYRDFGSKISELLADKKLSTELGYNALNRLQACFSLSQFTDKLVQHYNHICDQRSET